jgi:hypothetical protein
MIFVTEQLDPPTDEQIANYLKCKEIEAQYHKDLRSLSEILSDALNNPNIPDVAKEAAIANFRINRKATKDKFLEDLNTNAF